MKRYIKTFDDSTIPANMEFVSRSVHDHYADEFETIAMPRSLENLQIEAENIPRINFVITRGASLNFQDIPVITIGRGTLEHDQNPVFDLAPYMGRELGVSRYHARIVYYQEQYQLMDLNSSNGTTLNKKSVHPNTLYPIYAGDIMSFGLLDVMVQMIH